MFKYFVRVPIGSRWLLVGIAPRRWAAFSFHFGSSRRYRHEFLLVRVFWFEVCISELPF